MTDKCVWRPLTRHMVNLKRGVIQYNTVIPHLLITAEGKIVRVGKVVPLIMAAIHHGAVKPVDSTDQGEVLTRSGCSGIPVHKTNRRVTGTPR